VLLQGHWRMGCFLAEHPQSLRRACECWPVASRMRMRLEWVAASGAHPGVACIWWYTWGKGGGRGVTFQGQARHRPGELGGLPRMIALACRARDATAAC
jgi:hypothetical protein